MKKSALNFGIGKVAQKLLFLAGFMLVANVVWGQRVPNRNSNWTDAWATLPTSNSNITADRNITLTVNVNNAVCNNFTFSRGTVIINPNCSLSIGGTLNISGNNTTLTVNGTIEIANITSTANPRITGSGTIIVKGGTLNCNMEGFNGTLKLENNANVAINSCRSFNIQADNFTATSSIPGGTYTNLTVNGHSTLCGDVIVTGTLTWNDYRISLDGYSLTLNSTANISSTTAFSNSHCFVFPNQAETGFVTFKGDLSRFRTNPADDTEPVSIPVGNVNEAGNAYRIRMATITGTTTSESSFSVRPTNSPAVEGKDTDLKCYWTTVAENISNVTLTFTHIANDGVSGTLYPYYDSGSGLKKWTAGASGYSSPTITFANCTPPAGECKWTACEDILTYYSFTTGDWENANSWTFDPAGIDRTGSNAPATGPTAGSRVVIKNPDVITVRSGSVSLTSLTLYSGGTLDLGAVTGHILGTVKGQGTLKLASAEFPGGTFNTFVSAGGGTIEYNNAADFIMPTGRTIYNNLVINLSATNRIATLGSNLTVNGDFAINRGTFRIGNNNYGRTITVVGDLTVESAGSITTGTTNVSRDGSTHTFTNGTHNGHKLELQGDFTNNGNVSFTNQAAENYGTAYSNVTNVFFTNTTGDQNVTINGPTKFYSIRVQKGSDQTHTLNIDAAAEGQFQLMGPRTGWNYGNSTHTTSQYFLALAIEGGTVRLGSHIKIGALMNDGNYGYKLDEGTCLWIDGADVTVGGCFSFYVHGNLHVSNAKSKLDATETSQGIVYRTTANITIDAGTIETTMLRTSKAEGTHVGSITINDGTFILTGNGSDKHNFPTLGLTHTTSGFNMHGGYLVIERGTDSGNAQGWAFVIGSDKDNCSITGGTVRILGARWNNTNHDLYFTSTAPLWNLEIEGFNNNNRVEIREFDNNGDSGCEDVEIQPLVVLNDLTIHNNGVLNANNQNVMVGGNFSVEATAIYTPGTNTTIFNGIGNEQNLTIGGTITNGFNNLTVSKNAHLHLQNSVTLRGTLQLDADAILYDNQNTLTVNGNLVNNSGVHYNSNSATGGILLGGAANQTIGGDGHGTFNNLNINKTGGTLTMTANTAMTGNLRLVSNTVFNIGTYNLNLCDAGAAIYSDNATGANFSATKMIQTAGNNSDGGITKLYGNLNHSFTFPFGFGGNYLPATIDVDVEPTTYGSITSRPVNGRHYVLSDEFDVLQAYWHNKSNGFDGVTSVNHYYSYVQSLVGTAENTYVPAYYNVGIWYPNNNTSLVDQNNNTFHWESCSSIDGDFTCGVANAFSKAPERLFSAKSGEWNDPSTWASDVVGGAGGAGIPGGNTIVVIGDATHSHNVYTNSNPGSSGSLSIAGGSELDLRAVQGHNFGLLAEGDIDGTGTIVISSSNYFPAGDFGDFLGAGGGTVEYRATGADITMPTSPVEYNNLVLTATGTHYVTMPNTNIQVFGDLTSSGESNNYYNRFNTAAATHTVTVDGKLNVESGTLAFYSYSAQNLIVKGDVNVASGAYFNIKRNADFTNQLTIYGSMNVDGELNFVNGNQEVATTFTGTADASIKGAGNITLYTLTCDKGSDATPVLSIERNITATYQGGVFLNLLNGTFRADGEGVNIDITRDSDLDIASTACLSVKAGTFNVCNTNNHGRNVLLHGKIEVLGGNLNIGNGSGNDIECSLSQSYIDVQGGTLTVGGQIRRSYNAIIGDLHYSQSGGTVIIWGIDRVNEIETKRRGLIEVCNNGSFNMTGGTLTIAGGSHNNADYADILLTPATSSATGGTLVIGTNTSASQTFHLNASAQLGGILVGTENVTQILKLITNHVDINGSLYVDKNSTFNANGYNVNIAGNLFSYYSGGFVANGTDQITTFDGTTMQTISGNNGTTNISFSNLTISNPTTTQLSVGKATVNNLLTISRGALDDGGNTITVKGNVVNDSRHISSVGGGSLTFNGNGEQEMASSSGRSGTYGNIVIKERVELKNPIVITGRVTLNNDIYANDFQVSLMQNSIFDNASTGMIIVNGSIGDAGVRKYFADGFSGEFLFRIGVPNQYTPAAYNFSSAVTSSNGYINVKPMNSRHAAIANMPKTYLSYYWMVNTSGLSGYTVTHEYYYTDELLTIDPNGTEDDMMAQCFVDGKWKHFQTDGAIDSDANKISINGIDMLDGEFTAGFPSYSQLSTYYSRVETGDWTTPETWQYYDEGGNLTTAETAPNGNPIVIRSGHTITINGNLPQCAYSVDIEEGATLNVGSTLGHNLGIVRGGGTMRLEEISGGGVYSFMIPAGKYDEFFANPTSTINFHGDHNAVLPAKPGNYEKPLQNVIFSGNGAKTITANVFSVKGYVQIENGSHLTNTNRDFYIGGNFIDQNTTTTGYTKGTSRVIFNGTDRQNINILTDADFYNLKIDNSAGVDVTNGGTATNNIIVSNIMTLTNGNFITSSDALIALTNTSENAISGGGENSFVDGPLRKRMSTSGNFTFVVGSGERYGKVVLSNITNSGSTNADWTVEYRNADPEEVNPMATYDVMELGGISDNEYWIVSRPNASSSAKVGLRWDDQSCPMFTTYPQIQQRLKLVEYDGTGVWSVRASTLSGTATAGNITTTAAVTQDNYIFTLGYAGVIAAITTLETQQICNDGEQAAKISVSLSGTAPFTLTYAVDGVSHTQAGITESTYNITRNSSQLNSMVGLHTVSLVSISDASETGAISPITGSIEVLTAYTPTFTDGGGVGVAGTGELRTYEVVNHEGSTYSWAWDGGGPELSVSGNSASATYSTAGTYTLVVTEVASTTCEMRNTLVITVDNTPQPTFSAELNICAGDEITYATANNAGHSYKWYIDGVQKSTSSSFTMNWTGYSASDHEIVVEEINGSAVGSHHETITIYAEPSAATIEDISSACTGNTSTVTISSTESNVTYRLYRSDADNAINTLSGNGLSQNFTVPAIAVAGTVQLYVEASNPGCVVRIPKSGYETLTVNQTPGATLTWPTLYYGVESEVTLNDVVGAPLTTYNIDFTDGTNEDGFVSEGIKVTATSNIAGTITIDNENCSAVIPFNETMADGYVWSGAKSTAWNDGENWYSGAAPNNEHDAIIRTASRQPIISSEDAKAKSVKIESGELTISGNNTLEVYGDWQNEVGSDGFVGNTSTVAFNNDAEISGNTTFNAININSGKTVNIGSGHITVNGNIDNGGTLAGSSGTTLELAGGNDVELENGEYNLANLTVNKTGGSLSSNVDLNISGAFAINAGVLTMTNNHSVNLGVNATATSGGQNAFVEGTMTKTGSSPVTFPIGHGHRAMIGITPSGATDGSVYTAAYSYTPEGEDRSNHDDGLARVSGLECWNVTGTAPSSLTLYWDKGELSQIDNTATLVVAHLTGGKWKLVNIASRSGSPEAGSITTEVVNSYSPFTFGSTDINENPLPVEIASFTGRQNGNAVVLEWTTMSEKENDFFEIERSIDGINFVTIGFVQGAGNSTDKLVYSFADNAPEQGIAYYRLSQVDYDGTRSFADKVISLSYINGNIKLAVVPNPTRGMFKVSITGVIGGSAKLMTQSGKTVRIIDIHNPTESINISDLPSGIYILQYQTGENVVHERVVKL
ncbi:MAG: T9SS type A sorting domain-containing protein [Salinivirgaceae bacterium]|nr:T9SS type A sorting domain-containing protein [Salinivirgaceae bacterium]